MTKAEYLSLALDIGMDVKSAMLTQPSVVFEICRIRADAQQEARSRARTRD